MPYVQEFIIQSKQRRNARFQEYNAYRKTYHNYEIINGHVPNTPLRMEI